MWASRTLGTDNDSAASAQESEGSQGYQLQLVSRLVGHCDSASVPPAPHPVTTHSQQSLFVSDSFIYHSLMTEAARIVSVEILEHRCGCQGWEFKVLLCSLITCAKVDLNDS